GSPAALRLRPRWTPYPAPRTLAPPRARSPQDPPHHALDWIRNPRQYPPQAPTVPLPRRSSGRRPAAAAAARLQRDAPARGPAAGARGGGAGDPAPGRRDPAVVVPQRRRPRRGRRRDAAPEIVSAHV